MMSKDNNDKCACCGQTIDAYCKWEGPPFSQRAVREVCHTCICALRPLTLKTNDGNAEIAIVGTCSGDVLYLSEMTADGFAKKEATTSITAVGKYLGLPPFTIRKRLAN